MTLVGLEPGELSFSQFIEAQFSLVCGVVAVWKSSDTRSGSRSWSVSNMSSSEEAIETKRIADAEILRGRHTIESR
jgi:hypothetical protein